MFSFEEHYKNLFQTYWYFCDIDLLTDIRIEENEFNKIFTTVKKTFQRTLTTLSLIEVKKNTQNIAAEDFPLQVLISVEKIEIYIFPLVFFMDKTFK